LQAERWSAAQRQRLSQQPATLYPDYEGFTLLNLIAKMRDEGEEVSGGAGNLPPTKMHFGGWESLPPTQGASVGSGIPTPASGIFHRSRTCRPHVHAAT
jgi:hypothetical protein